MAHALVTLLTDFGMDSPYVAEMKGILYSINPSLRLVDITHAIPPQDVSTAGRVLADVVPSFPRGTVHVVVVDPGVGTRRRLIGFQSLDQYFFGPDNGVFEGILRRCPEQTRIELTNRSYWRESISPTFHGRDILAPVAAHRTRGVPLEELGAPCHELQRLPWSEPVAGTNEVRGESLWVDRFGNIVSNITSDMLEVFATGPWEVRLAGQVIRRIVRTYGEAESGELVALFGSQGRLEIARVNGSAADTLHVPSGVPISMVACQISPDRSA